MWVHFYESFKPFGVSRFFEKSREAKRAPLGLLMIFPELVFSPFKSPLVILKSFPIVLQRVVNISDIKHRIHRLGCHYKS